MSMITIDYSSASEGDEWLDIAGEVLTISNSLPASDICIEVNKNHKCFKQIKKQVNQLNGITTSKVFIKEVE